MITPALADALGSFASLLIGIGVKEAPAISDAIQRAMRGDDALAGLAAERVRDSIPEKLQLEIEMAAQRVRVEAEAAAALIRP